MSIPTKDPIPRTQVESGLLRWANELVQFLTKHLPQLILPVDSLVLVSPTNNNVKFESIVATISGPAAPFTVTGIAGGSAGRIVILHNTTAQNMTLVNEGATSQAANRITTQSGANVVTAGVGIALLVYNQNRWQLLAFQG